MMTPDTVAQDLAMRLRGTLLRPDDVGYEDARQLWNAMIEKRPAVIARCTGVADVVEALQWVRQKEWKVAVRGGGHSVAGLGSVDGGIVIDLSPMRGVHVDRTARTVRVQAGATWGDVDRETQLFALATPGGIISTTGVAGLTLGGGFGWLSRKYGLAVDNLLSVDLVTAAGDVVRASEDESRDLFWAVRGRRQLRHRHLIRVPAARGRTRGTLRTNSLPPG
jgi:FAD/FMN-containing dehydrogenase